MSSNLNETKKKPNVMFAGAYITGKRLNATTITTPFSTQPLSLLTVPPPPTFAGQAFTWVYPFDPDLWYAFLGTAVFSGIFFVLIEGNNPDSHDFGGDAFKSWYRLDVSMALSVYNSLSTMNGATSFGPRTPLGYLFAVTWSFFCLVLVASYTAKLAVWLSFYVPNLSPQSFSDLAHESSGFSACVLANSAYSKFLQSSEAYGQIKQVPIKDLSSMVEAVASGRCSAIIERQMHLEHVADSGRYRDLGQFLITDRMRDGPQQLAAMVSNSDPAMDAVKERLPYWITRFYSDGTLRKLYEYSVLRGQEPLKRDEVSRLTTQHLGGWWLVFVGVTLLVLLGRLFTILNNLRNRLAKNTLADYFEARVEQECNAALDVLAREGQGEEASQLKPEEVTEIRLKLPELIVAEWKADEPPFPFRRRLNRPTSHTLNLEARHLAPKGATVMLWNDLHSKYALVDVAARTGATEATAVKHYDNTKHLAALLRMALELVAHAHIEVHAKKATADGAFRLMRPLRGSPRLIDAEGFDRRASNNAKKESSQIVSRSSVSKAGAEGVTGVAAKEVTQKKASMNTHNQVVGGSGPRHLKHLHTTDFMKSSRRLALPTA
eukprot:g1987.t1